MYAMGLQLAVITTAMAVALVGAHDSVSPGERQGSLQMNHMRGHLSAALASHLHPERRAEELATGRSGVDLALSYLPPAEPLRGDEEGGRTMESLASTVFGAFGRAFSHGAGAIGPAEDESPPRQGRARAEREGGGA